MSDNEPRPALRKDAERNRQRVPDAARAFIHGHGRSSPISEDLYENRNFLVTRAAGLPLVTALTGVGVGVGGAFALSHLVSIHSLTAVLALMLGLAVGIDYLLFIVNRQRRLIFDLGLSASVAASRAIGTAGSAVVFAGSTVVIALLALTLGRVQVLIAATWVRLLIRHRLVAVSVAVLVPGLLAVPAWSMNPGWPSTCQNGSPRRRRPTSASC